MRHPRWVLTVATTVVVASGCQTQVQPPTHGASSKPSSEVGTRPEASVAPPVVVRDNDKAVPPTAVQALSGTVKAPDAAVIGSGGSLVNDGGVILFRIMQAVADQPIAGATVTLVDAEGEPVSAERATTDAEGRFSFGHPPVTDEPFFVQADFTLQGEAYAFQTLADSGAEPVEVDAASTLVAEKTRALVKGGKLKAKGLSAAKTAKLAAQLRKALRAESLPFMAKRSKDMAAAFDQLLADQPALAEVAAELAAPVESWQVDTVLKSADLVAAGVLAEGAGFSPEAAVFEVDPQGNLYFATAATPVKVVKIAPGGATSTYATLPSDVTGPVRLAFSPSGVLHVMGLEASTKKIVVLSGEGETLTRRPSYPKLATRALAVNGLGDRVAVNAEGDVFVAVPKKHVILKFPVAGTAPTVLAGAWDEAGWADGAAARFSKPAGLAIGPAGALFVADAGNNAIRRVTMDGQVSTVAGQPGESEARGGRGAFARFGAPMAIAVDSERNIYFTDTVSKRVQRLTPAGSVFYVAGQKGEGGVVDGPGAEARFAAPGHLAVDGQGHVYLRDVDGQDEYVRKISR